MIKQNASERPMCVTIIPSRWLLRPSDLNNQTLEAANRWLRDQLAKLGIKTPIVGSIDLDVTTDGIQLHWHLVIFSPDREVLQHNLKPLLPKSARCQKPVIVKNLRRLAWLNYSHKLIKLSLLLTRKRRLIPRLMIALTGIEPLAPLFLMNVRMRSEQRGISFQPIH